jgi:hypothetical protein
MASHVGTTAFISAPIHSQTKIKLRGLSRDRRLAANLVPTFANRGCRVVSTTDPHGRILGFLRQYTPKQGKQNWDDERGGRMKCGYAKEIYEIVITHKCYKHGAESML